MQSEIEQIFYDLSGDRPNEGQNIGVNHSKSSLPEQKAKKEKKM